MSSDTPNYLITIPIYEGVDLMDVAGPCEFFGWWASAATDRNITVTLAAETIDPVTARGGVKLSPMQTFTEYYKNEMQTNLLWTPGGDPNALAAMMKGGPYLDFLDQQSEKADWVTSVCEGAMLLAAAGLLNGYMATTHWAFIPCFSAFPEIKVAEGFPRFVVDRNRATGGGISSGLDESLELIRRIAGEEMAQDVQLNTQYYPCPPVSSVIPGSTSCPIPGY
jgi:transcriptional regulator GlxA family with amidase domain